ncbi:hypothetical protein ACFLWS_07025 [Chloroflexota bacterium]
MPIFGFSYVFWKAIGVPGGAEKFPLAWFIIIAAILGAVVNQASQKPIRLSWLQTFIYVMWKSSIAIVFAFVLYFIIMGGLISGDVFPKFINTTAGEGGNYTSTVGFATKVDPESYADVAKILVWSFIAGYSERFVPNIISKIGASVQGKKKDSEEDTS